MPAGTRPASTNIRADACPCIHSDLRVTLRVRAPEAQHVQVDVPGKRYDMVRDTGGIWTVTTDPQVPGFHYYSLVIDGVAVADPASQSFYGTGRMSSGIEIPEAGADFDAARDVPHGSIRAERYFSKFTGRWRRVNVYVPPGYDESGMRRYPVLYIQHGGGEDETGWAVQGHTDLILDNLIADGRAVPMLVVIGNGNVAPAAPPAAPAGAPAARSGGGGYSDEAMQAFASELFENLVPFIERRYRAATEPKQRAIAGLSMGGGQAFFTGLRHTGRFGAVGVFSSGIFGGIGQPLDPEARIPGILSNPKPINDALDLFYISVGEQDPRFEPTKEMVARFRTSGLDVAFASFPGAHEWQVWRKSLNDFAPRIFK
ncbi:MAG: esterase [Gemmatimonadetes bacterium]|nr:esterase [Gemmatimonadota bacterium]